MPVARRSASDSVSTRSTVPLSRRFTYRYLVALVLVGVTALFAFASVSRSLDRIDTKSRQLEQASNQAARIYLITDLAVALNLEASNFKTNRDTGAFEFVGDLKRVDEDANQLKQELTLLRKTQSGLLNGDDSLGLPATELSPRLHDVFFEPDQLDQKLTSFGNAGQAVLDLKVPDQNNSSSRQNQILLLQQMQDETVRIMQKSVDIYRDEVSSIISEQRDANALMLAFGVVLATAVALLLFRPMAQKIRFETTQLEEAEQIQREHNERQSFRSSLGQALEVTDSEEEIFAAVGRAFVEIVPGNRAELLLTDASQAHLRNAQTNPRAGAAGCPVDSPEGCAAIRRGQTQIFATSTMLNVCPKLPEHAGGACSAVCIPVTFTGQAIGVLHAVGPDEDPPDETAVERLSVLAAETGNALGTLRVRKMTELQASTDGLTGLLNRRSLESKARKLLLDGDRFSIAIADLDHFKDLNDTYGHETGDRALRLFAKVMRDYLRPGDIPSRFGGEEFVVLLPQTNIHEALAALERLQVSLAAEIERATSTPFTASWGLTDHRAGTTFDEMIAVADAALYSAKRAGRNCIVVDGEAASTVDADADQEIVLDIEQPPVDQTTH